MPWKSVFVWQSTGHCSARLSSTTFWSSSDAPSPRPTAAKMPSQTSQVADTNEHGRCQKAASWTLQRSLFRGCFSTPASRWDTETTEGACKPETSPGAKYLPPPASPSEQWRQPAPGCAGWSWPYRRWEAQHTHVQQNQSWKNIYAQGI